MNPEPMAYESTAPPLSYLATMPNDITRNRPKSQLFSPIQIFTIGTARDRSLPLNSLSLTTLDRRTLLRGHRRHFVPRDDGSIVGRGLTPSAPYTERHALSALLPGRGPFPTRRQTERHTLSASLPGQGPFPTPRTSHPLLL